MGGSREATLQPSIKTCELGARVRLDGVVLEEISVQIHLHSRSIYIHHFTTYKYNIFSLLQHS